MIKQIQLRGISRTPSDRMTSDGGCAESLNVHLTDNELSPTLAPDDVTETLGLPTDATKGFIYIHKGNGYTNYITLEGQEIGAYVGGAYTAIASMAPGEEYKSMTSIGNTLVIMGSVHPYYALFKDDHYIFLGNKIPLPTIRLTPEPVEDAKISSNLFIGTGHGITPDHVIPLDAHYSPETWNEKAKEAEDAGKRFAGIEDIPDEEENWDIMSGMKAFAEQAYREAKEKNVFIHQVMAAYAIRLYNGSYISSVPCLIPGGFESPFYCRYLRYATGTGTTFSTNAEYIQYGVRYPYRIKAQLLDFDSEMMQLWSDIIMSIDFFFTPTIPYDLSNEKVMYVAQEYKPWVYTREQDTGVVEIFNYFELRPSSNKYARNYINRVLAYGSGDFRKAESISTDNLSAISTDRMAELREGTLLDINDYISDQDLLQTQRALADYSYDMANAEKVSDNVTNLNNRILLAGVTETLSSGLQVFPAAPCYLEKEQDASRVPCIEQSYRTGVTPLISVDSTLIEQMYDSMIGTGSCPLGKAFSDFGYPDGAKYLQLVYHIKGGESYAVRGRINENGGFVDETGNNLGFFGFLLFPDARCATVDIYLSYDNETWYKKSYEMREHPNLNCSYLYIGADKNLLWDIGHVDMTYEDAVPTYTDNRAEATEADISTIGENRVEHKSNTLLLSDVDNPWFFPLENQYQLQATEIVGTALATKALSTGQFGQFPLYVFTDNGIWAMQMNSFGTFSSSHAVSMEVAKKGTILSLDQAVVFLTDKGVMMLTGSDIQNLSLYMNGKHYIVENAASSLISRSIWSGLLDALVDGSHFMLFMEGATPVYDYAGERMIFFNKDKTYMYVYMFRTSSWHKSTLPEGVRILRTLNSYPESLLSATNTGYARLLDFSTALDVTSGDNIRAVIVTRPMDLGEPDIRKTIKSIRIRGQFNRNDVKYILLGSMDGINWGVLPSLRGGSYKWYRMIILASLSPIERISWIDIDYESRFANKLR